MSLTQKKKRNRLQTMQRILLAASDLIQERGLEKAGINAIAEKAGINKVLVYRYFGTWNGLVETLFQKILADLLTTSQKHQAITNLPLWHVFAVEYNRLLASQPVFFSIIQWLTASETALAIQLRDANEQLLDQIVSIDAPQKPKFRLLIAGVTHMRILSQLSDFPKRKISVEEHIKSVLGN